MAFQQKTVNTYPGIGIPGAYATINPIVSTAKGYVASAACNIGGFVWADENKKGYVKPTGTGCPLGFAVREITNPLEINVKASNTVPAGYPVSVEVKGDFFAVTTTAATVGQKVFAVLENGTIKTEAAQTSVEGAEETDFEVIQAGAANDVIIISNWRGAVVPASTSSGS
ncbi:structural cement protein Gp24 [Bacteroides sp.]|uniref:structural cement protein Gp24 n=1 Tax=Bacteroides sp. TaxID=29523 RepID=UPI003AB04EDF